MSLVTLTGGVGEQPYNFFIFWELIQKTPLPANSEYKIAGST
jgi:hypothetical protein